MKKSLDRAISRLLRTRHPKQEAVRPRAGGSLVVRSKQVRVTLVFRSDDLNQGREGGPSQAGRICTSGRVAYSMAFLVHIAVSVERWFKVLKQEISI